MALAYRLCIKSSNKLALRYAARKLDRTPMGKHYIALTDWTTDKDAIRYAKLSWEEQGFRPIIETLDVKTV